MLRVISQTYPIGPHLEQQESDRQSDVLAEIIAIYRDLDETKSRLDQLSKAPLLEEFDRAKFKIKILEGKLETYNEGLRRLAEVILYGGTT